MLKKSIVAPRNIPKTLTPWSSSLYWFRPTSQVDRAGHFLLHIWYSWSCRYARYLRGFLPHLRYAQLPSFSLSPSLGFSFIMPVSPSHGLPPSHLITHQSSKSSTVISYTSGHQWCYNGRKRSLIVFSWHLRIASMRSWLLTSRTGHEHWHTVETGL